MERAVDVVNASKKSSFVGRVSNGKTGSNHRRWTSGQDMWERLLEDIVHGEASIQASADAAKGGPQGPQDVCVCGGGGKGINLGFVLISDLDPDQIN